MLSARACKFIRPLPHINLATNYRIHSHRDPAARWCGRPIPPRRSRGQETANKCLVMKPGVLVGWFFLYTVRLKWCGTWFHALMQILSHTTNVICGRGSITAFEASMMLDTTDRKISCKSFNHKTAKCLRPLVKRVPLISNRHRWNFETAGFQLCMHLGSAFQLVDDFTRLPVHPVKPFWVKTSAIWLAEGNTDFTRWFTQWEMATAEQSAIILLKPWTRPADKITMTLLK